MATNIPKQPMPFGPRQIQAGDPVTSGMMMSIAQHTQALYWREKGNVRHFMWPNHKMAPFVKWSASDSMQYFVVGDTSASTDWTNLLIPWEVQEGFTEVKVSGHIITAYEVPIEVELRTENLVNAVSTTDTDIEAFVTPAARPVPSEWRRFDRNRYLYRVAEFGRTITPDLAADRRISIAIRAAIAYNAAVTLDQITQVSGDDDREIIAYLTWLLIEDKTENVIG